MHIIFEVNLYLVIVPTTKSQHQNQPFFPWKNSGTKYKFPKINIINFKKNFLRRTKKFFASFNTLERDSLSFFIVYAPHERDILIPGR